METLKEKVQFIWKHNKRALIIAGIAWKVLATMIMVEKCKGPEDLTNTVKQNVPLPKEIE